VNFFGVRVTSDTTLAFSLDGNAVSGTVTGQGGQPLAGASVRLSGSRAFSYATTGVDGTYLLYVPTGEYDWYVQPSSLDRYIVSRRFSQTAVTAPETRDFDMSGPTWTGTVRSADTGQPVPGCQVSVYGRNGSAFQTAGSGGEFMFVVDRYDVYEMAASSYSPPLQGFIQQIEAGNDSTFDILVSPAPVGPFFAKRRLSPATP
jgi:hypothetical protein